MNRLAIAWLLAACGVFTAFAQAPASAGTQEQTRCGNPLERRGLEQSCREGPGRRLCKTRRDAGRLSEDDASADLCRVPARLGKAVCSRLAYTDRRKDSQRIKDGLAALVREEVVRQLSEGGYTLVDTPGEDVLDVEMSIVDLNVAAPDIQTAGRVETFAVSAGEMTLVAALRDSVSGDVAMRIFDRAQAREYFRPQRITSVDNISEARDAAKGWAKALRKALDLARTVGTTKP